MSYHNATRFIFPITLRQSGCDAGQGISIDGTCVFCNGTQISVDNRCENCPIGYVSRNNTCVLGKDCPPGQVIINGVCKTNNLTPLEAQLIIRPNQVYLSWQFYN